MFRFRRGRNGYFFFLHSFFFFPNFQRNDVHRWRARRGRERSATVVLPDRDGCLGAAADRRVSREKTSTGSGYGEQVYACSVCSSAPARVSDPFGACRPSTLHSLMSSDVLRGPETQYAERLRSGVARRSDYLARSSLLPVAFYVNRSVTKRTEISRDNRCFRFSTIFSPHIRILNNLFGYTSKTRFFQNIPLRRNVVRGSPAYTIGIFKGGGGGG